MGGKKPAFQAHLAGDHELDGWNTGEIVVQGDRTTHILNGKVVNEGTRMRVADDRTGQAQPLVRGRIALQIEAAEIDYRDVEIRRLSATPATGP
jgi:hypothetical protein